MTDESEGTMNTQPEALRLADILQKWEYATDVKDMNDAATELRRLHDEVERLTEELRRAKGVAEHFEYGWFLRGMQIDELLEACKAALSDDQPYIQKCKAAIAKAEGMEQ